jgi:hypothetical protein
MSKKQKTGSNTKRKNQRKAVRRAKKGAQGQSSTGKSSPVIATIELLPTLWEIGKIIYNLLADG